MCLFICSSSGIDYMLPAVLSLGTQNSLLTIPALSDLSVLWGRP